MFILSIDFYVKFYFHIIEPKEMKYMNKLLPFDFDYSYYYYYCDDYYFQFLYR